MVRQSSHLMTRTPEREEEEGAGGQHPHQGHVFDAWRTFHQTCLPSSSAKMGSDAVQKGCRRTFKTVMMSNTSDDSDNVMTVMLTRFLGCQPRILTMTGIR